MSSDLPPNLLPLTDSLADRERAELEIPEPHATGFGSPEDRSNQRKPIMWSWQSGHFAVVARADAVDVAYDFDGRMGEIDLACYSPEQTRELAATLLAAAAKAEQAARRDEIRGL